MKILLDENIPRHVKFQFPSQYIVMSSQDMGWEGKKNGELLALLIAEGFEIFKTLDKNLQYQQNLSKFNVTIFLLSAPDNTKKTFEQLALKLIEVLNHGTYHKFEIITY
ncbi:MAG TPA: DUF5615 family PIN-like protein [Bacteroidia bacterium]|nr:DUF5615 family PIN-like protein [Bacteroidia bacterium]